MKENGWCFKQQDLLPFGELLQVQSIGSEKLFWDTWKALLGATSNIAQDATPCGILSLVCLQIYACKGVRKTSQISLLCVVFYESTNWELFAVIGAATQRRYFFLTKSLQAQARNAAMPLREQIASRLPLLAPLQHNSFIDFLMYWGNWRDSCQELHVMLFHVRDC